MRRRGRGKGPAAGESRLPVAAGRVLTGATAVLLAALLLLMVNYLGWKYHHRADWTEEQLYALSEKTRNVLDRLDRDVRVVVFLPGEDPMAEPVREVLERYSDASPRLSVDFLDPERNPLEAQRLAERYAVETAAVVFDDGEDRRVVAAADLAEYDFSGLQMGRQPEMAGFRGEQRFTQALLDLAGAERPRVLFTTGHGEISLDDRSEAGLGEAVRLLRDDNFEIEEWASRGAGEVPAGTDLVVIAGPTATFLPPELDLLDRYLERGGRLLVLLDPALGSAGAAAEGAAEDGEPADGASAAAGARRIGTTGLEEWLLGYGVDAGRNVVVDPANAYPFFGAETFYAERYPASHPATRSVRQAGLPVLLSLARSVAVASDPPQDLETALLLEASADAWGESDLEAPERGADDLAGPVALGVAVEGPAAPADDAAGGADEGLDVETEEAALLDVEAETGDGDEVVEELSPAAGGGAGLRLVVFGDSTFATDQLLAANVGNAALLADTLNWLVEREDLLGIPPRRPEQVRLTLTGSQLRWIYLVVLGLLPGLAVVLGVFVHYRRRR